MARVVQSWRLLRTIPILCAGIALATLAGCDKAQESKPAASAEGIAHAKIDAKVLEQWADETFGRILAEKRVSGLAISVTQGDDVIFKKGYGWETWGTE